ncbi:hypothetical protein BDD12DRAFT_891215 [Trichophaea hybrida]|nr:hypothetical protein BDD12DRAFT_891215 [Trichophaea hybrida]
MGNYENIKTNIEASSRSGRSRRSRNPQEFVAASQPLECIAVTNRNTALLSINSNVLYDPDSALLSHFSFDKDLHQTRVYRKAMGQRSMESLNALDSSDSGGSGRADISISDISNISFAVIPVCIRDPAYCYAYDQIGLPSEIKERKSVGATVTTVQSPPKDLYKNQPGAQNKLDKRGCLKTIKNTSMLDLDIPAPILNEIAWGLQFKESIDVRMLVTIVSLAILSMLSAAAVAIFTSPEIEDLKDSRSAGAFIPILSMIHTVSYNY